MAYATSTDLEQILPEGALDDLAPSEEEVSAALDHASATVDAYLAGRYAVPFSPPPSAVVACAADLAAYRILSRASQRSDEFLVFRQRAEDWMAYLKAVGEGRLGLPGAAPAVAGAAAVDNADQVDVHFDRDTLKGFFDKPKPRGGLS